MSSVIDDLILEGEQKGIRKAVFSLFKNGISFEKVSEIFPEFSENELKALQSEVLEKPV